MRFGFIPLIFRFIKVISAWAFLTMHARYM